jgi:hypothetical protein
LESSGTPECLEFDSKAQNTLHWGVLGVIGKVLKCRYRNWPCIGHLDICSPSYGQKKGRESNWQFDSRPLKVGNDLFPTCAPGMQHDVGKLSLRATSLVQTSSRSEVEARSYEVTKSRESKPGQFRDSTLRVPGKEAIRMPLPWANAKNTIGIMVVAFLELGPWCVM